MEIDPVVNISDDIAPYGRESAFSQLEHNIVAGYLIIAGRSENITETTSHCVDLLYWKENTVSLAWGRSYLLFTERN